MGNKEPHVSRNSTGHGGAVGMKILLVVIWAILIVSSVWAYLDQKRIDATPKERLQSTDYGHIDKEDLYDKTKKPYC